jgi:hypothetical protein
MRALMTFISIVFFSIHISSFSQPAENWLESSDPVFYPKVYLHTDREVYFPGDSIWFKAYYMDGQTQKLFPGDYSLYADLVDEHGQFIQSQVLLLEDGQVAGKIEIPDSIHPGNYLLRAFTDFQRNIGEDAFYHKTLIVTSIESSMEKAIPQAEGQRPEIDVAFLPEGGFMLAGQVNCVAVKAVDDKGTGIPLQGEIIDGNGEVVTQFNTQYKGMGSFQFSPLKEDSYHVRIKGYPDFEYTFDDLVKEGIKIEYSGESKDNILFNVTTNSESFLQKSYYFAILNRGRVLFQQAFVQNSRDFPIKINHDALAAGINRFVLLDEQLKPISERLYFSRNIEIDTIKITADQNIYSPRHEVQIEIFDEKEPGDTTISNLSMAVVDSYALGVNGPRQNILSWFLIDSELKGNIESPAHFFKDDDYLSSKEKLNLLMLTNGWSRYIWTSLAENPPDPGLEMSEGITLKGTVKHALTKKPIVKGDVELKIYTNENYVSAEGKTDKEGRFSFDNVVFTDTAAVFIQGRNKKGNLYTVLDLDTLFKQDPEPSYLYLPKDETKAHYSSQLYEQKYFSDLDLKNFVLENGSILLEEVTITKKRDTGDGHFRLYLKPYNSMKITNKDYGYMNVGDYLQGRVSGIMVFGNTILMRGLGSFKPGPPLFLIDGTPMPGDVIMSIPMSDIDVVEVLKDPEELAIFGVRAGNGVISIFTHRGGASIGSNSYVQGTISKKLKGYSSYREFYSPRYTPDNIASERPDHRLTLYWNPAITTDQGKAMVSFFTSDDNARYKILVEGVTQTGEISLGISEFEVSRNNSGLDE